MKKRIKINITKKINNFNTKNKTLIEYITEYAEMMKLPPNIIKQINLHD